MPKQLKILLIGAGSIGKRHLANLCTLGYENINVISRSGLGHEHKVKEVFQSLESALKAGSYDAAFICTPTSHHIEDLLALLQNGVTKVYVEKPLSNTAYGLLEVLKCSENKGADVTVGYDLHFEPGLQKIKELLQHHTIGKIISANAFVGQHLPQWRPHEDHRNGMSAKKETGGGVMLDLVHEIDYLYYLLGDVKTIACNYTNTGELEIETEEAADMLLNFSSGAIATVHLDYWQPQTKRFCIFTGTKGVIHWDLVEQRIVITNLEKKTEEFSYSEFSRNDRFVCIVKTFLESPNDERLTKLPEATKSLEIVFAAKHAAENSCVVDLVEFHALSPSPRG